MIYPYPTDGLEIEGTKCLTNMCLNCGCGEPNNSHNDERNITLSDLKDAGEAAGVSTLEALANMVKTMLPLVKEAE